jgi:DNA-binding transcriptional LysR family regulator
LNLSNYTSETPKQFWMPEPLRIQQIRQFVITATTGSFRAAATGTFRSQAAVSAAMRDLERQVGGKLFENGRRAKLTPFAETLCPIFQHLLATHDRTIANIRQLAQAERGSISIAVVPFLSEEWLPELLIRFAEKYPDIRMSATDQRSHQVRSLVADGGVDIGIAGLLTDDPKLTVRPVLKDEFGVLCAKDHPIASEKAGVTWDSLARERLIGSDVFELLKGSGFGEWLEEPAMMVTSRTSLMACVRANLGITLLPLLTRPADMQGLAFTQLVKPRIDRTIGIVTRRGQTLLPAAAAMEAEIVRSLTEYGRRRGAKVIASEASRKGAEKR